MKRFEKYSKYIINFIFCVAVIAVYKTFDNLSNITSVFGVIFKAVRPFIIGFSIAYIINIPAVRIDDLLKRSKYEWIKKRSYGLSILITYIVTFVLVFIFLSIMLPAIYNNVIDLYSSLPGYVTKLSGMIQSLEPVQKLGLFENGIDLSSSLNRFLKSVDLSQFGKYAHGVFAMTSGVVSTFISIIASVYMLLDKRRLQVWLSQVTGAVIGGGRTNIVKKYLSRMNVIFVKYLYSRLICCIIMAVVCGTVFAIMRVKYAMVLGLFVGIMDMIPYFGSIIASVISVMITFITGGVWKAVWAGVFLLIAQQLDGNLLSPRVMGNRLDIRPLVIVFAVTVGGSLFGVPGMILSVPAVAIIRELIQDIIEMKEKKVKKSENSNSEEA